MKKREWRPGDFFVFVVKAVAIGLCAGVALLFLVPVYGGSPGERCLSAMHIVASSLKQYAESNDGRLPGSNWEDAINHRARLDPGVDSNDGCYIVHGSSFSGYAMNKGVVGKNLETEQNEGAVMLFETDRLAPNIVDLPNRLPFSRHKGVVFVALAGGQVWHVGRPNK